MWGLALAGQTWHDREMKRTAFPWLNRERERQEDDARFTTSLAAMAATLFLGVVGLYVLQGLAETSKLEDCLMQGRPNCERIETTALR